jgi:hypothetical protein
VIDNAREGSVAWAPCAVGNPIVSSDNLSRGGQSFAKRKRAGESGLGYVGTLD